MQIYLPFDRAIKCSCVLSTDDIEKQINSIIIIIMLNLGISDITFKYYNVKKPYKKGQSQHSLVKLWYGFYRYLFNIHFNCLIDEWTYRKCNTNTITDENKDKLYKWNKYKMIIYSHLQDFAYNDLIINPPWINNKAFHDASKAALYNHNPEYYKQFKRFDIIDCRNPWAIAHEIILSFDREQLLELLYK